MIEPLGLIKEEVNIIAAFADCRVVEDVPNTELSKISLTIVMSSN